MEGDGTQGARGNSWKEMEYRVLSDLRKKLE
jgi:hypothetical protein